MGCGSSKEETESGAEGYVISQECLYGLMQERHGDFGEHGSRRWWLNRLYAGKKRGVPCSLRIEGAESSCRLMWDESGMSLEADCGKTDIDTIVFLYKGGKDDSHLTPGGQRWCVNRDGTVSPIQNKHMVLGYGTRTNLAKTCGGKNRLHGGKKDVNDGVLVLVPQANDRVLVWHRLI